MDWMIYGASGYTGELIAELARTKGLSPVLAGRSQAKVRPLAEKADAWHRWFYRARDPAGTGLVAILHPWESGRDHSARTSPGTSSAVGSGGTWLSRYLLRPSGLPGANGGSRIVL